MENNYISGSARRNFLCFIFFLIMISSIQAQTIVGNNPYCIASGPNYTVINGPDPTQYTKIVWSSNDPGISFAGDPADKAISKVVIKPGNIINAPGTISATFMAGDTAIASATLSFATAPPPVTPTYVVTKTNDYCTNHYHIITLNVTPNPNPSPNTNYNIAPRIPDASIVITQTSKNNFELKLPLNGQSYFLYDITSTTSASGCLSNSVTNTSYGNAVSLNLTGCANTTPGVNYDFSVSPNPYSNGYITIVASAVTPTFPGTCRVYNSSGIVKATFSLTNSSTSFPLKSIVGASLTTGLYIVQVTYPNGIVKTKNVVVN